MNTPELHVCVVACCIHYSDPLPSLPVGESSLKEAPHCSGASVYRENVRQFMIVCECVGACVGGCGWVGVCVTHTYQEILLTVIVYSWCID